MDRIDFGPKGDTMRKVPASVCVYVRHVGPTQSPIPLNVIFVFVPLSCELPRVLLYTTHIYFVRSSVSELVVIMRFITRRYVRIYVSEYMLYYICCA